MQAQRVAGAVCLVLALALGGCSTGPQEPEDSSSAPRIRLMTGEQYSLTIRHIFGADISASVPSPLPPMPRTDGLLASGAASIGLTSDQLQRVHQAAVMIATQVVDEDHREFLIPCKPASEKAADAACAERFLERFGRLWYRHPLDDALLARLVQTAGNTATQLEDFYGGLAHVIEGMLISPKGLFIIDVAEPDPNEPDEWRLDAWSLASRLSFFLWNSAPDDALLQAAESGELQTKEGLELAVDRMLASPRLEDGVRAFFDDMMEFIDFDFLAKNDAVYPAVTGATLSDAREQTLRTIVDHLVDKKGDYRDLFTTRSSFMSPNLAVIYGVPTTAPGWAPYEFSEESHRAGLLTHVSFSALHSHPARSSPTLRGMALREVFLCQKVPPPPPNVDFSSLEDPDPSLRTNRERLLAHAIIPSCAGCHKIMDPIGLALENFDGAGRYRATQNGASIDASGMLDGVPFENAVELGQVLHDNPSLPSCLVNRVYSYGTGGPLEGVTDRAIVEYFTEKFAAAGYRLPELLRTIALSAAFSEIRFPEGDSSAPAPTVETMTTSATSRESSQIAQRQN